MKTLNYSVPLINVATATVKDVSQVVSYLPRTNYEKLIIGHYTYPGALTNADMVDTSRVNAWSYIEFGASLYVETVDTNKAVWRDIGTNNVLANYWYLSPIYVKPNTLMILHYANMKTSAAQVVKTLFYVARTVVYH
jgi:hypothetical protein